MKNIIVYYQKDFNPYAKYTINFKKTHISTENPTRATCFATNPVK